MSFALYVHVPYCRNVCPYCDFTVVAAATPPEREYTRLLVTEIRCHARHEPWTGRRVKSVSFGGGTPSLFSPTAIGDVLRAVDRELGLAPGAEVALEANPGTVSVASLAGYRAAGVNRLSLGAQSFDPAVLARLGRDHCARDTHEAVAAARAAGFDNLSLDLIFAVPEQSLSAWAFDLEEALALGPEHVSAYCLTWEERTPFHAWRAQGRLHPVDEDTEAAMVELAAERLEAAGLARYEISSWTRPGFASRHNQSYWDGSDYLGVGTGAHGFCRAPHPGVRWVNERTLARYRAAVEARGTGVAEETSLSESQARAEFLIAGLRRTAGVEGTAFRDRFAAEIEVVFPHVRALVEQGLLEWADGRLRLTRRGLAFADTVAASFV